MPTTRYNAGIQRAKGLLELAAACTTVPFLTRPNAPQKAYCKEMRGSGAWYGYRWEFAPTGEKKIYPSRLPRVVSERSSR